MPRDHVQPVAPLHDIKPVSWRFFLSGSVPGFLQSRLLFLPVCSHVQYGIHLINKSKSLFQTVYLRDKPTQDVERTRKEIVNHAVVWRIIYKLLEWSSHRRSLLTVKSPKASLSTHSVMVTDLLTFEPTVRYTLCPRLRMTHTICDKYNEPYANVIICEGKEKLKNNISVYSCGFYVLRPSRV